jgi:hypothetical protein
MVWESYSEMKTNQKYIQDVTNRFILPPSILGWKAVCCILKFSLSVRCRHLILSWPIDVLMWRCAAGAKLTKSHYQWGLKYF